MLVLVINSGSSSIKFRLVEVVEEPTGVLTTQPAMLQGAVKGIGGVANFEMTGREAPPSTSALEIRDHEQAASILFEILTGSLGEIEAVGHRVVHGGDQYVEPTLITAQVEEGIDALSELAPLHNSLCLEGIRGARAAFVRRYRWWPCSTRPFTGPCRKSPGGMRSLLSWPSGIGSVAMVFTGLRMPRL